MSAEDFAITAVVRRSSIGKAAHASLIRLRADMSRSVLARAVRASRHALQKLRSAEGVRLTGVLVLTAVLTNAVLLQWTPPPTRPAAPALLRVEFALAAVALIALAAPMTHAWRGSRLRRLVSRALARDRTDPSD